MAAAIDRTGDWNAAVDIACERQHLGEEARRRIKASLMMKPVKKAPSTPFMQATDEVRASIADLRAFVDDRKRDYVAAAGRLTPQQKDAVEVEVMAAVSAARARLEQLTESVAAAQRARGVNAHAAAHLHGAVLVLAELLQAAGAAFDRCRAVRRAQQAAEDARRRQRRAAHFSAGTSGRPAEAGGFKASNGGVDGVDGHQQQQQAQQQGQGQQQEVVHDQETQQLLDDLMRRTGQVQQVERTVREIAAMQQMISTAVAQQAEAIEQIYNEAVAATLDVRRGNAELTKTLAVNRSSTLYLVVLLLVASALLLLYDWINS